MFILTTVVDRIRVPAHMLSLPTLTALHNEIDLKLPTARVYQEMVARTMSAYFD
jgi:hypothetical protein